MATRNQLDHETLMGLIGLLEAKGVLTSEEATALKERRNLDSVKEVRRGLERGNVPERVTQGGTN